MTTGKSIRLFLEDGTPGGLISAEIVNWTGSVVTAPRSDLARLIQRPEARGTGVYILVGDDQDKLGGEIAYIGEADDISKRLRQHAKDQDSGGKDFWLRAVIITSKDTNLTKAHVRYLESRLITIANQAQRMALVNSTAPSPPPLPEADISDMEFFIEQLKIVLPVLNLNILRTRTKTNVIENKDNNVQGNSPIFKLKIAKENITAQAQEIDGEFTVLEGSQARNNWVGKGTGYKLLREKLENDGSIKVPLTGNAIFIRDVVFASPSAAAGVITGRNANGRRAWKDTETGLRYGRWQDQALELDEV